MTTLTAAKISDCQNCESDNVSLIHVRNRLSPDWFYVKCEECELIGEMEKTPEAAIEAWNGEDDESNN